MGRANLNWEGKATRGAFREIDKGEVLPCSVGIFRAFSGNRRAPLFCEPAGILESHGGSKPSSNVLTCVPQSFCSWDFRILGASAGPAALSFNFFTEQGDISLGSARFTVRKHGPLSGRWTLEHGGQTAAEAHKPGALFRRFELESRGVNLTLKAQSALTRCYDIFSENRYLGTIRPAHPFTRRAFIECAAEIPEITQLFAFWLVVITWRRAANNSAANSSA